MSEADMLMNNHPNLTMHFVIQHRPWWRLSDRSQQFHIESFCLYATKRKISDWYWRITSPNREQAKVNLGTGSSPNRTTLNEQSSSDIQWRNTPIKMIGALKLNREDQEAPKGYTKKISMTNDCPVSCEIRCPL
jgi:hypothetical protein